MSKVGFLSVHAGDTPSLASLVADEGFSASGAFGAWGCDKSWCSGAASGAAAGVALSNCID